MPLLPLILLSASFSTSPADPPQDQAVCNITPELIQWMEDNFPIPCWPDLTHDGVIDFFDLHHFFRAFTAQIRLGDWNNDGVWDHADLHAFLTDYAKGCPAESRPRMNRELLSSR